MYTTHGHHIPGSVDVGIKIEVALCGGVKVCGECKREVRFFESIGEQYQQTLGVPQRYLRKPDAVKAMRYLSAKESAQNLYSWLIEEMGAVKSSREYSFAAGEAYPKRGVSWDLLTGKLELFSKFGVLPVEDGDWVIMHSDGEPSTCKPYMFELSYSKIVEVDDDFYDDDPDETMIISTMANVNPPTWLVN